MKILTKLAAFTLMFILFASPAYARRALSRLTGGGMIVENGYRISFGGNIVERTNGFLRGQMQVNFHNVSNDETDKGRFHAGKIQTVNWYPANSATCTGAMNVTMIGRFNRQPDWKLIFRAGDNQDTVRFELFNPSGAKVYDTHAGDFTDESSCVGSARTGLDRGNLRIIL